MPTRDTKWIWPNCSNLYKTMGTKTVIEPKTKPKLDYPKQYKVLLHNDDFTPMEFVVRVMAAVFQLSEPQAVEFMLYVHFHGVGVCGIYSYEIAESKINQVHEMAEKKNYPLLCSMEEA